MGFDINEFKTAFFSQMRGAANAETVDGKINTDKETQAAKNIQTAFKNQLSSVTEPIGDSFVKNDKTEGKGEFDNISISDLTALLDDPDLNIERVNQLIEEKPVETLKNIGQVADVEQPKEVQEMAEISDADTDGVKFYADKAVVDGRDNEIAKNTDASEEGMDVLGAKFFDAFMTALYAA